MRDLTRSQKALYGLFWLASLSLLVGKGGIVTGRVTATDPEGVEARPMKQFVTRHTFKVEAYYKESGPDEFSLMTLGGMQMEKVGDETHPTYLRAIGAEGVRDGEEFLAFLRAGPLGYCFVLDDGAKYLTVVDPNSGDRSVEIRLRKRRYMQPASQAWFDELERAGKEPNAPVATELPLGKFITESAPVTDISARLQEIIQGEGVPPRQTTDGRRGGTASREDRPGPTAE